MCNDCCCCEDDRDKASVRSERRNVCCTDILLLALFLAFLGGMIYIATFSFTNGDGLRMVQGYDSFGNTCHRRNIEITNISRSGHNTIGLENVFFLDIIDPFKSMHICASKCPDKLLATPDDVHQFAVDTGSRLCAYDIDIDSYTDSSLYTEDGPCPKLPVLQSISLMNRCFPDVTVLAPESIRNTTTGIVQFFNADDIFRKVLRDMYSSKIEMLLLCFVALGFALVMVFTIRFLAKILVWVIVILAGLGSIAGTAFLWWTYYTISQDLNAEEKLDIPLLDVDISNEKAFFIFAIVATVLTVLLLVILLVMRSRLQFVVKLFHESSKCLISVPLLLVQPIWTFIILMLYFAYWLIVMSYLSTAGPPEVQYDRDYLYVEYSESNLMRYMWWYHVFGLIWVSEFILACQQFVVAGAAAIWYFAPNKNDLGCPIGKSTSRLILHHLGSIAFGSLIITAVKFPRWVLMYLEKKMRGSENSCAKCCMKCCICCLWCLEKILKYINKNAYTVIAMEGRSFCPAAKAAFGIIVSNAMRVAAINSVGDFILFLAKVAVMAATAAVGIVWLKDSPYMHYYGIPVILVSLFAYFAAHVVLRMYSSDEDLHYYAIPVILVCVFAYFIAHCFLSVFEMVVDALMICFCVDESTGGEEMKHFVADTTDGLNTISRRKPHEKAALNQV